MQTQPTDSDGGKIYEPTPEQYAHIVVEDFIKEHRAEWEGTYAAKLEDHFDELRDEVAKLWVAAEAGTAPQPEGENLWRMLVEEYPNHTADQIAWRWAVGEIFGKVHSRLTLEHLEVLHAQHERALNEFIEAELDRPYESQEDYERRIWGVINPGVDEREPIP